MLLLSVEPMQTCLIEREISKCSSGSSTSIAPPRAHAVTAVVLVWIGGEISGESVCCVALLGKVISWPRHTSSIHCC